MFITPLEPIPVLVRPDSRPRSIPYLVFRKLAEAGAAFKATNCRLAIRMNGNCDEDESSWTARLVRRRMSCSAAARERAQRPRAAVGREPSLPAPGKNDGRCQTPEYHTISQSLSSVPSQKTSCTPSGWITADGADPSVPE